MTIEIELPSWRGRRERYWLIDVDGKANIHGYVQRPSAERHASRSGYGLYDSREQQLVVPIDTEKRLAWHRDQVARHASQLQEAHKRLSEIEEAADAQRDEREAADAETR